MSLYSAQRSTSRCSRNEEARQLLAGRLEAGELVAKLTNRETAAFQLVARGFTNPELSEFLSVSKEMIKVHRARVMRKLEAISVPDLVVLA
jgi:FixJ family two-component response regulator